MSEIPDAPDIDACPFCLHFTYTDSEGREHIFLDLCQPHRIQLETD